MSCRDCAEKSREDGASEISFMTKEDGGRKGEGVGEFWVLHEGERALKVTIINAALSDESIYNQHYSYCAFLETDSRMGHL